MTIGRRAALSTAAVLLLTAPVQAQSAAAEALFREGKELLKQGKLAEACAKFDASDRIEPSVGTELNAADCHERLGKLATAWATFLKAAANARKAGNDRLREAEARRRAAALEPRLSYLTISVPESSRVAGLVIRRNGEVVDSALWNTGIPVDIGEYEISGEAPGHEAWSTKIAIEREREKKSVEVPRFKEIQALVHKPSVPDSTSPQPEPSTAPLVDSGSSPETFTTMRKIAIGTAAVGLGAIGGSVFFGLRANDLQSQAEERCPNAPACTDPMAVQLNDDARTAALRSNVMLGIGVAAIGGAAVLWLVGAPDDRTSEVEDQALIVPVVSGHEIGLSFSRRF